MDDFRGDVGIVERVFDAVDFLVVLVAFAGDQHDCTWLCSGQRMADGLAAISDGDVSRTGWKTGEISVDDVFRLFCTRVVAGNDYQVGILAAARAISGRLLRSRSPRDRIRQSAEKARGVGEP